MGTDEAKLAAAEGTFAYHTMTHNHSFRSMDCTSVIVRKVFDNKFTCARTKAESIVVNIFAPFAVKQIVAELSDAKFVSVLVDGSNHKNIKLIPVLVRYYLPGKGIKVKILEFENLRGETSDMVSSHILKVLEKYHLTDKIISFSADNTNTNFGGAARKGTKNIYAKLCTKVNRPIVRIGCAAHILHNSMQTAADCLPIDIESVVNKIYQYFYIYTVRVAKLEEFCNFVDINYSTILGHSKTRWLSLSPAVERIIHMFEGLKSFFLSEDKCPTMLKAFFQNPSALLLLNWLYCQLQLFNATIKLMESQEISATELTTEIENFIQKLTHRMDENFLTSHVKDLLAAVEEEGESGHMTSAKFKVMCTNFYVNAIEYIKKWAKPYMEFRDISWIIMNKVPQWREIGTSMKYVKNVIDVNFDENVIFDEFSYIKAYAKADIISMWQTEKIPTAARWLEMTTYFKEKQLSIENILSIVEFSLALPGTNAAVERIFSLVNSLWTDEKNRMSIKTVGDLLIVKTHFKLSCLKFHSFLIENETLLKEIHSSKKYGTHVVDDSPVAVEDITAIAGPSSK